MSQTDEDPFKDMEFTFNDPDPVDDLGKRLCSEILPSNILAQRKEQGSRGPAYSPQMHGHCNYKPPHGFGSQMFSSTPHPTFPHFNSRDNPYDPRKAVSSRCWCPGMGMGLPCHSLEIDLTCGNYKLMGMFDSCPPPEPGGTGCNGSAGITGARG